MKLGLLAWSFGCCVGLAGWCHSERAHAQETVEAAVDAGRSHFKAGVDYYRDGDLTAALIEFKRAYAAAPNYRLLYNLGQVSHELRQYIEAQNYLQRYLEEGGAELDAARRQEVEVMLAKVAARIARVVVSCNITGAELYVDDVSVGHSPLIEPVPVSAGTRRISAAVSGRPRITKVVEVGGGDALVVKLEFSPLLTTQALVGGNAGRAEPASGPSPALFTGIGAGVVAVGAGVMAYLAASDASDYRAARESKTTATALKSLYDSARTKALVTDILLGTAAAAAAVTVVLMVTNKNGQERAPVAAHTEPRAQLTLGAGSIGLNGRFN